MNTTDPWPSTNLSWTPAAGRPETPAIPPYIVPKIILCTTVQVATLLGNTLVLYAFATERKIRTYSNYYIVGLAVADLISGGILAGFQNITWVLNYWPLGEVLCMTAIYTNHVFLHATYLLTLAICIDRVRAVTVPFKHLKEKTVRHAGLLISVGYVVPFLIWTPLIVIFPLAGVTVQVRPPFCAASYTRHPPLLIFSLLVMSWLPMFATAILYVFVYSAAIRRGRGRRPDLTGTRNVSCEFSERLLSRKRLDVPEASPCDRNGTAPSVVTGPGDLLDNQTRTVAEEGSIHGDVSNDDTKPKVNEPNVVGNSSSLPKWKQSTKINNESTDSIPSTATGQSVGPNQSVTLEMSAGALVGEEYPTQRPLTQIPEGAAASAQPRYFRNRQRVYSVSAGLSLTLKNIAYDVSPEDTDDHRIADKRQQELPVSPPTHTRIKRRRHRSRRNRYVFGKSSAVNSTHNNRAATPAAASSAREGRLAGLRATRTLTYILVVMVVSGLPWSVYAMAVAVNSPKTLRVISDNDALFLVWLVRLSSTMNPFCYAVCNPLFKAAFLRILRCSGRQRGSQPRRNSTTGVRQPSVRERESRM